MKRTEITIDVDARISISKETAERCLALVEMYLNDNEDVCISGGGRHENGKVAPLKFERAW